MLSVDISFKGYKRKLLYNFNQILKEIKLHCPGAWRELMADVGEAGDVSGVFVEY